MVLYFLVNSAESCLTGQKYRKVHMQCARKKQYAQATLIWKNVKTFKIFD